MFRTTPEHNYQYADPYQSDELQTILKYFYLIYLATLSTDFSAYKKHFAMKYRMFGKEGQLLQVGHG